MVSGDHDPECFDVGGRSVLDALRYLSTVTEIRKLPNVISRPRRVNKYRIQCLAENS